MNKKIAAYAKNYKGGKIKQRSYLIITESLSNIFKP